MVIQQFPLNMVAGREVLEVHVNQYDVDFQLFFDMYQGASGYAAASGTAVTVRGTKPDGNGYSANATITQTAACTTVRVDGARQLTAACGVGSFELVFAKSGKEVSSANFHLCVERAAMDLGTISDSEILELYNLTREDFEDVLSAKAAAESAAADAASAADAAQAARDTARAGYITRTASGSPAAFEDGADAVPVKSLTVQIPPVQAGSGDPSLDNIRPFAGRGNVTITRTGENGGNSQSVTIPLVDSSSNPLTVYGGTLNVTTGTLSVTHILASANSASLNTSDTQFTTLAFTYVDLKQYGYPAGGSVTSNFSANIFAPKAIRDGYIGLNTNSNNSYLWCTRSLWESQYVPMSKQDFINAAMDIQFLLPLPSPATYQLTPQEVTTLLGVNTIAADCGEVSVTYRADAGIVVKKLEDKIDDLRSAILSMGSNV